MKKSRDPSNEMSLGALYRLGKATAQDLIDAQLKAFRNGKEYKKPSTRHVRRTKQRNSD